MSLVRPLPVFSNRSLQAVALFCTFALGGGLELLNSGRPFPSRLLGTWQEEEETKGAKGRDETGAATHACARRHSPRPPSPPSTARRHATDVVARGHRPATHFPLRSGAGQFQRC